MKAVVVCQPGGVEVMHVETVADPVATGSDVVIQVEACGVCMHDIVVRNGTMKAGVELPCILGHEISGTVVDIGPAVARFKPGDRVATTQRSHICGACRFCRGGYEPLCAERKFLGDVGLVGGYAQYVAVEADNVALVPDGVPLADASIAACAVGTIYNAVTRSVQVKVGDSVLVTGAGGGLGLHAVQIANALGAHVIAQTSSPDKVDLMKSLGAHDVVLHDRGDDFSQQVKQLTGGRGVDIVVDNVGTPVFEPTRRSLGVLGRWLMIGQLDGSFVPFNPAQLFLKGQSRVDSTESALNSTQEMAMPTDSKPEEQTGPISGFRVNGRRWKIKVIAGPNMAHLGQRDRRLFGTIESFDALAALSHRFAESMGVDLDVFVSDYEGEILEYLHANAVAADGFIVDPGGLTTVSEGWRHALQETHKPAVEVSFYNLIANHEVSVFTPTVIGRAMGLRQYSYVAALLGLTLSLDDESFLNPGAPESVTVRRGGQPYAFKNQ